MVFVNDNSHVLNFFTGSWFRLGVLYFKELRCDDGVILSIDKIVIDGLFRFGFDGDLSQHKFLIMFFDFVRHVGSYGNLFSYETWESLRSGTYHNQFSILCDNGNSFWFGCGFNGYAHDLLDSRRWRLEFNPNKVYDDLNFLNFFFALLTYSDLRPSKIRVRRFDLAIDYPVSRSCCSLVKDGRTYSEYCNSKEDRPQNLGTHNKHGFVKLYNKQIESKLAIPLTRLELTIDYDKRLYSDFEKIFPKVYVIDDMRMKLDTVKMNDTDVFILLMVLECPERLKMLGRKKKEKIERTLNEYARPLEINRKLYMKIIQQVDWFVKFDSVCEMFRNKKIETPTVDMSALRQVFRDKMTGERYELVEFTDEYMKEVFGDD